MPTAVSLKLLRKKVAAFSRTNAKAQNVVFGAVKNKKYVCCLCFSNCLSPMVHAIVTFATNRLGLTQQQGANAKQHRLLCFTRWCRSFWNQIPHKISPHMG